MSAPPTVGALDRLDAWLGPPGGRWRRTVTVALVLLVAALVAVVVVVGLRLHTSTTTASDAEAGEQAARDGITRLLSYDSADLAPTRTAIDELSTGIFHDQFESVFTQVVMPNAVKQQARTSATVRQSGVVSAEPGRVVALMFVNQTTSSRAAPGDRVDTIQARVTVVEQDDRWVVSGLDQV